VGVPIAISQNVTTSYPIAVVKSTTNEPLARAWIAYVLSPTAQNLLHQAGFCLPLDGHGPCGR
ncbi:MAG: substrate-binding domain-containing protein, partial [Mycobacterium sp.]